MLNVCIDSIQSELFHDALLSLEALQIVFLVYTKCGMEHRSKECSDVIYNMKSVLKIRLKFVNEVNQHLH